MAVGEAGVQHRVSDPLGSVMEVLLLTPKEGHDLGERGCGEGELGVGLSEAEWTSSKRLVRRIESSTSMPTSRSSPANTLSRVQSYSIVRSFWCSMKNLPEGICGAGASCRGRDHIMRSDDMRRGITNVHHVEEAFGDGEKEPLENGGIDSDQLRALQRYMGRM